MVRKKRSNMVKKASKVGETAFFSYFWGEISVMYAMKNCLSAIIAFLLSCVMPMSAGVREPERVTHYDTLDGLSSTSVGWGLQDGNGLLWFATWNGLNCYDGYDFHRVQIRPGDRVSISTNRIRDILLSDDGNILCRTDEDIYEYDLGTYSFKDITPERKDSLRGRMGRPWRGFYDRQGNFWSGNHQGLNKRYTLRHPASILAGTADRHPRALMLDRDSVLWVGTRTDRCVRRYDCTGILVDSMHLATAPYCIFQTSAGDVWIGGKPGSLMKYGGESVTDDAVYDIKEDRRGRLWVATYGDGVKCIDNPRAGRPSVSTSLGGHRVRRLLITPSDRLIAATTDGLLIGSIATDDSREVKLRRISRDGSVAGSLCSNATMSLAQDSRGRVYVATESSGIDVIDEDVLFSDSPEFTHVNTSGSSLTSDIVNAMTLHSDSLLMIAGSDNVMAYNPVTGRTQTLSRTFWGDSCRFAETTPLCLPDGTWVFGAGEGAYVATAESIYGRDYVPPVVFTSYLVNGESECFAPTSGGMIEIPAGHRNITVSFAAIDYTDNRDILYRTRLDGSPWTGADRTRSVTLFNMSAGTHRLEVQSTDRYGRWVDNVAELKIDVPYYWYETIWARLLFAVMGVGFVTAVVYTLFYIRNVNRHRRELLDKYMALLKERDAVSTERTVVAEEADGEYEMPPLNPDQKPEDTAFLNRVRKYIEENLDNPEANVDDMAVAAAASRSTLNRHLRAQLGITAAQLLIEARMQRARQLLGDGRTVAEVADMCGYADVHYFQRAFKKKFGVNPGVFGRG